MQITSINLKYDDSGLTGATVHYSNRIQAEGFYETASGNTVLTAEEYEGKTMSELVDVVKQKRDTALTE